MCGIVAVISKKWHKDASSIFKQLLYVGTLRGWDGAGLFKVSGKSVDVIKQPGPSSNLLYYLDKPPVTSLYSSILVGHNRASTRGENTKENTHPFQEDHITLVHNGTVHNHKSMKDTDVDSHAICHYLTDHTPQEAVTYINGAYALVWYDNVVEELRFMRNKERPLFIIHTEDMTILVSERKMGEWILSRNGVKINDVEEVKPFVLYSIKKDKLHDINKEELTEPPVTVSHITAWAPYQWNNKKKETDEEEIKPKEKDKILPITKVTTSILESLESRGLKKNQRFTAYCYASERLGTSYKNFAIADFDMQEEVIFYANDPYEGSNVSLIFSNLLDDKKNNSYFLFGHSVIEEVVQEEIKRSINGVKITTDVNAFLHGRVCVSCKTPYSYRTVEDSYIHEVRKDNGFVSSYTYVCPDCAPFVDVEAA